jgi:cobalt transporter subunit CbtA
MPLSLQPSLRRLLLSSIAAGAIAGSGLFALQYWTMRPLIAEAERYEHGAPDDQSPAHSAEAGWEPADGLERTALTAAGTMLTGIAFAAISLGTASLFGYRVDARRGIVVGAVGFCCFVLAPSIGLPPRPPGVPSGELVAAQAWWCGVVMATAVAFGMIFSGRSTRVTRALGLLLVVLPHALGAPRSTEASVVPIDLIRRFAWMSVGTRLPFWLVLGVLGGYFMTDRATSSGVHEIGRV